MVCGMPDLSDQLHSPIGVGGEVLDGVGENLIVSDERSDVIRSVESRREQADFVNRAGQSASRYKIPGLERPQNQHKRASGKIGQQTTPGCSYGETGGG